MSKLLYIDGRSNSDRAELPHHAEIVECCDCSRIEVVELLLDLGGLPARADYFVPTSA
jgi:hypothetical protein